MAFTAQYSRALRRRMYRKLLDKPFGRIAYEQFVDREERRPTYHELNREREKVKWVRFGSVAGMGPSVKLRTRCTKGPVGWRCTRAEGHEGPCAAWPVVVHSPITGRMSSTVPNVREADWRTPFVNDSFDYAKVGRILYHRIVEGSIAREESAMLDSVYPTFTDSRNANHALLTFNDVPNGALVEHYDSGRIGLKISDGIAWFKHLGRGAGLTSAQYYPANARVLRIVHGNIHISR